MFFVILACSWALLHHGFFRVHDYVHAGRIAEMWRGLSEGQFPVRWSGNFGFGYGMPLFSFYAPLPYFVGALFWGAGLDVIASIKLLYLITAIGSWFGMYFLAKNLFGKTSGLVAATLFTLAPYRAMNLFLRGALSESWALMAAPWILLGIWMTFQRRKYGSAVLITSLVTLFLSHNISILLFVPFSLGIVVLVAAQYKFKLAELVKVALSYIIAIALSAFYLIPAFVEKDFTRVERGIGGYFAYSQHFLYIRQFIKPTWSFDGGSGWGPDDGISFFLGYGQWLGLAIIAIILLVWLWQHRQSWSKWFFHKNLQCLVVFLGMAATSLFMTLEKSLPIWKLNDIFKNIQFPWRWLGVAEFWLALATAAGITLIPRRFLRMKVAAVIVLVTLAMNWQYFRPSQFMDHPENLYKTDLVFIQSTLSSILPDYIPIQMDEKLEPPVNLVLVPEGLQDKVSIVINLADQKLIKTSFQSETKMDIEVADFPGWKLEIDGQEAPKLPGPHGSISVMMPKGEHFLSVEFAETPVRAWSDRLSGVTAAGLLIFCGYTLANKKVRHAKET